MTTATDGIAYGVPRAVSVDHGRYFGLSSEQHLLRIVGKPDPFVADELV